MTGAARLSLCGAALLPKMVDYGTRVMYNGIHHIRRKRRCRMKEKKNSKRVIGTVVAVVMAVLMLLFALLPYLLRG